MMTVDKLLIQAFVRPQGWLGRVGGLVMAQANRPFSHGVIERLDVQPADRVLEVGFGPRIGIEILSQRSHAGY